MKGSPIAAVLPAAGRATRMGGIQKELLPLGRADDGESLLPVLAWSLHSALLLGAETCTIVTSPSKRRPLSEALRSFSLPVPVTLRIQREPTGMADAVATGARRLRNDAVVIVLMPDTVLWPLDSVRECVARVRDGAVAAVTLHAVDHPERFAPAIWSPDGRLVGFVEKPEVPPSEWTWTSIVFRKSFIKHVDRARDAHGSLTAAIDAACACGELAVVRAEGDEYCDIGTPAEYVRAVARFGNWALPSALRGSVMRG